MNTTRVRPEEARAKVLAALRTHDYKGKTSELAQWTGMQSSVVRRAALYLASKNQIVSVLLPGRGKGEYLFHLSQLDLFEDQPPPATIWQKVKRWFR
jgi:hypothetical protein